MRLASAIAAALISLSACGAPARAQPGSPPEAARAAPETTDKSAPTDTNPTASKRSGADPSVNKRFLDPKLKVKKWVTRFEGESREVFVQRWAITRALSIRAGDAVADIGAGTGLFTGLFDGLVGQAGKVYAVDISPRFLDYLRKRQRRDSWQSVEVVAGSAHSPNLPPNSVDLVFICDTYHHFEHVDDMLAGLHSALRPGGRLVLVDFYRIPGKSEKWVLGHVRAGMAEFRQEIERAGFELRTQHAIDGLKDNYVIELVKKN